MSRTMPAELRSALLREVLPFHRGYNVYHSKSACVAALSALQRANLPWWTPGCSRFVSRVANVAVVHGGDGGGAGGLSPSSPPAAHPIVVVEGLDGVGKTTMTTALTQKLGGVLVRTPDPELEPLRALFRSLDEPLARAFYCGANYLAAAQVTEAVLTTPVVLDRWWCSTCAMTLAGKPGCTVLGLPPATDPIYQWPSDLPAFDVGVLLQVDEAIRRLRMKRRNDENEEEALLAAKVEMRDTAMEAYRRFGLLTTVDIPNYMVAVNHTLDLVAQKGFSVRPNAKFIAEELAKVLPY
ncbi:thymidylate kinase, putative [Bodo saltans]|uniref:Thymidylate kinase, putative n=1 Tax=Bodo saltans TaxID=75058 RepID=A0A0S4JME8_BODSA|nr:thymidylate kinase, putative [Bodo saltans]|eukprot:CUG91333.1 thymidylate kinase, putative [Bodo saltans]